MSIFGAEVAAGPQAEGDAVGRRNPDQLTDAILAPIKADDFATLGYDGGECIVELVNFDHLLRDQQGHPGKAFGEVHELGKDLDEDVVVVRSSVATEKHPSLELPIRKAAGYGEVWPHMGDHPRSVAPPLGSDLEVGSFDDERSVDLTG